MPTKRLVLTVIVFLLLGGSVLAQTTQPDTPKRSYTLSTSSDDVVTAALADNLAVAMDIPTNLIKNASLGTSDTRGAHVFSSSVNTFPLEGNSFAALSSGKAKDAATSNTSPSLTTVLDGLNTTEDNTDLVQLTLKLKIPTNATFWGVDFKFFSEEYPEFVGSSFNDAFLIETPASTFTINTSTNEITAPNNVAFDPDGNLVTINSTGPTGMTAGNAFGTTYDGATDSLTAYAPVPAGVSEIKIVFSVMDISDSAFDTTVFLDNFRFVFGDNPPGDSQRPVINVPPSPEQGTVFTTDIGEPLNINLQASDPDTNDTVAQFGILEPLTGSSFTTTAGNPGTTVFSWTPVAGQEGVYVLPFIAIDSNGTTSLPHNLVVVAGNIAPLAVSDTYSVTPNTPRTVSAPGVLANDSDVNEDTLTVNTTPVVPPTSGDLTLNADGGFTYTPDPAFYGLDYFEYEVSDGELTGTTRVLLVVGSSLLLNPSFETAGFNNQLASAWAVSNPVNSDRRICDKPAKNKYYAFAGACAFQLTGNAGVNTVVRQKLNTAAPSGDQVIMNAWVRAETLTAGGRVQVVIKLADGAKQKITVDLTPGSYNYTLISGNITLTGNATKLNTKIVMNGGSGKFWIEDVFVATAPAAAALPLPDAPSSLGTR